MKPDIKLFVDGKRLDGRRPDEMRKIKIEAGVLHRAEGSCYLEWGGNKIIAAIYGPREAVQDIYKIPCEQLLMQDIIWPHLAWMTESDLVLTEEVQRYLR
jgi:hypothetical protein